MRFNLTPTIWDYLNVSGGFYNLLVKVMFCILKNENEKKTDLI